MKDTTYDTGEFRCLEPDAIVSYVYEACDPAQRAAVEAHATMCAACAEELSALRATRTTLGAWTPPPVELGFQIDRPPVLRPARWWTQPLPAWAQAAAAIAIFASGLAIGAAHTVAGTGPAPVVAAHPAAPVATPVAAVTRQDLDLVEQRLRGEIAQVHTAPAPVAARASNDDVISQVRTMIAESEQRQQRATAMQTAKVALQLEEQRKVDLTQIQHTVGEIQSLTGVAMRNQDQMARYLVTVSQRR